MKRVLGLLFVGLMAAPASAQITVDGTLDGAYGPALAVQDTPTGFGNNLSELNAAYANWNAAGVNLLLTGNLEAGGNGLVIFIDSRAGGAIASTQGDGSGVFGSVGGARIDDFGTDTDGGAGVSAPGGGPSILDPGFNPDLALEINISGTDYFTNIIDLTIPNEPNPNKDVFLGGNGVGAAAATQVYTRPDADVSKGHGGAVTHAFNNSNTAGVNGYDFGSPPGPLGDPLSATSGYEVLLSSAFLANDGQPIRFMPFITNNSGSFLANQFLGEDGGVAGAENLGSPGGVGGTPLFDAGQFAGNQFFTVIPEPATFGLAGVATLAMCAVRRRK